MDRDDGSPSGDGTGRAGLAGRGRGSVAENADSLGSSTLPCSCPPSGHSLGCSLSCLLGKSRVSRSSTLQSTGDERTWDQSGSVAEVASSMPSLHGPYRVPVLPSSTITRPEVSGLYPPSRTVGNMGPPPAPLGRSRPLGDDVPTVIPVRTSSPAHLGYRQDSTGSRIEPFASSTFVDTQGSIQRTVLDPVYNPVRECRQMLADFQQTFAAQLKSVQDLALSRSSSARSTAGGRSSSVPASVSDVDGSSRSSRMTRKRKERRRRAAALKARQGQQPGGALGAPASPQGNLPPPVLRAVSPEPRVSRDSSLDTSALLDSSREGSVSVMDIDEPAEVQGSAESAGKGERAWYEDFGPTQDLLAQLECPPTMPPLRDFQRERFDKTLVGDHFYDQLWSYQRTLKEIPKSLKEDFIPHKQDEVYLKAPEMDRILLQTWNSSKSAKNAAGGGWQWVEDHAEQAQRFLAYERRVLSSLESRWCDMLASIDSAEGVPEFVRDKLRDFSKNTWRGHMENWSNAHGRANSSLTLSRRFLAIRHLADGRGSVHELRKQCMKHPVAADYVAGDRLLPCLTKLVKENKEASKCNILPGSKPGQKRSPGADNQGSQEPGASAPKQRRKSRGSGKSKRKGNASQSKTNSGKGSQGPSTSTSNTRKSR